MDAVDFGIFVYTLPVYMPLYLFYIGELVDSICPKSFNRIQKTQCGIINPC